MSVELVVGALVSGAALAIIGFVWRKRTKAKEPEFITVDRPLEMTKDDMFRFLATSKSSSPMGNVYDFLPDRKPGEWPHDPTADPELTRQLREAVKAARSDVPGKESNE